MVVHLDDLHRLILDLILDGDLHTGLVAGTNAFDLDGISHLAIALVGFEGVVFDCELSCDVGVICCGLIVFIFAEVDVDQVFGFAVIGASSLLGIVCLSDCVVTDADVVVDVGGAFGLGECVEFDAIARAGLDGVVLNGDLER